LSGALSDTPKFSNNDYYNSNNFSDDRSAFYGTLTKWQAKGLDAGSTYTAGAAPLSADFNHDGRINVDDYTIIDLSIANPKSAYWLADANLDGKLNVDDYTVIDVAVAQQGAASGATASSLNTSAVATQTSSGATGLNSAATQWTPQHSKSSSDDVYLASSSVLV
jgi:hypothetical protein